MRFQRKSRNFFRDSQRFNRISYYLTILTASVPLKYSSTFIVDGSPESSVSQLLSWLGIQTGELNLPVTVGALFPILAALIGWAVYAGMRSKRSGTVQVFTGGDPLPEGDRVGAVDFAELADTTFTPVYRVLDPDPLYQVVWHGVRRLGGRLARGSAGLENRALLACVLLVLVMAAAVWIW